MAVGQEHGFGEHLAILGHVDADRDDGFRDVDDLVNAMRNAVLFDETFQLFINFISDKADANVRLDAPGCEVEHRPHLERAF